MARDDNGGSVPDQKNVISGVIGGFYVSERALVVLLTASDGAERSLRIPRSRPDFLAQLEVVKYALQASEEHEARAANGFDTPPAKELWALVRPEPTTSSEGATVFDTLALGLAAGTRSPFGSPLRAVS